MTGNSSPPLAIQCWRDNKRPICFGLACRRPVGMVSYSFSIINNGAHGSSHHTPSLPLTRYIACHQSDYGRVRLKMAWTPAVTPSWYRIRWGCCDEHPLHVRSAWNLGCRRYCGMYPFSNGSFQAQTRVVLIITWWAGVRANNGDGPTVGGERNMPEVHAAKRSGCRSLR